MANRFFGEAEAKLADDRRLTLRFDFNALCEVEDAAKRPIAEVMNELSTSSKRRTPPRLSTLRALVFGGLAHHHPELSREDVGDLVISDDGKALTEAMQKALEAASASQSTGGKDGARPPGNPRRGTGSRS